MRRVAVAAALALALALTIAPALAYDIPYLTGRVVDEANIISQAERDRLTAMLKAHEQATTNQVVVLTVPTIGQASIEEYSVKVFEAWKLGQKGKDNGILVVVVPQDRKMRIEVGYGLESTLPDGAAGDIIRTWMTPAFKAGNYDKGIEDGVAAIIARLEGRGGPVDRTPAEAPSSSSSSSPRITFNGRDAALMPMSQRLLFGAFIFGMLGLFTAVGIGTPGVGWFIYFFMIPFWAMFPMVIIGSQPTVYLLIAYLVGFPLAKISLSRKDWYQKAARDLKTTGRTSIGGFVVTSGGGSGGSSWSSGGGGFSGGGGSSGGGGASGSW